MKIDIANELRIANQEPQEELRKISIGLGVCAAIGVIALISFSVAASYASNSRPWAIAASLAGGLPIAIAAVGYWGLFIMKDELQPLSEEQVQKLIEDFENHKSEYEGK